MIEHFEGFSRIETRQLLNQECDKVRVGEGDMEKKTQLNKKAAIVVALIGILAVSWAIASTYQVITSQFVLQPGNGKLQYNVEIHLLAKQYRDGKLISESNHQMSLTNAGKDWIADNLFNKNGANNGKNAMYIASSPSTAAFDAIWVAIPAEITSNGLSRALAAWTDTAGFGTGSLYKSFSVTGTQSTQLYGLYYDTGTTNTLVAAEQQGSVKNMVNGDTLAITIQITIS